MTNAVAINSTTKKFYRANGETVVAVDNLSFEIHTGEIFGLLGSNGAGKTTTLRMISTVLKPTSGEITVGGFDTLTQSDEVRRRIGFLSGNTGLYKRLKAWEMVAYFGQLYGMDDEILSRRIDELFAMLQLEEFRDVQCDALSSGNRQKVSIARTIVHDPPILVFDEPTANLDPLVARTLLNFIIGLKDEGKTIVFSTHIMTEAERLCARIAIIHRGRLLEIGTIPEILERTGQKSLENAFFVLAGEGVWE